MIKGLVKLEKVMDYDDMFESDFNNLFMDFLDFDDFDEEEKKEEEKKFEFVILGFNIKGNIMFFKSVIVNKKGKLKWVGLLEMLELSDIEMVWKKMKIGKGFSVLSWMGIFIFGWLKVMLGVMSDGEVIVGEGFDGGVMLKKKFKMKV